MISKIIQRLAYKRHIPLERKRGPEFPIAAEPKSIIRSPGCLICRPAKHSRARITNDRRLHQKFAAELSAIHAEISLPLLAVDLFQVPIAKAIHSPIAHRAP